MAQDPGLIVSLLANELPTKSTFFISTRRSEEPFSHYHRDAGSQRSLILVRDTVHLIATQDVFNYSWQRRTTK